MAKYYFHVVNGKMAVDTVGVDVADMEQVREQAIRASGQMLSDSEFDWSGETWRMFVADESDVIVFSMECKVDRHGL